jgi:hypothetical protein
MTFVTVTFFPPTSNSQGWVDEDSESGSGNPFSNLFGGGKRKTKKEEVAEKGASKVNESKENQKKSGFGWPF